MWSVSQYQHEFLLSIDGICRDLESMGPSPVMSLTLDFESLGPIKYQLE